MNATPPTTPPAMAPTGVDEPLSLELLPSPFPFLLPSSEPGEESTLFPSPKIWLALVLLHETDDRPLHKALASRPSENDNVI